MIEFILELLFVSLPFTIITAICTIVFGFMGFNTLETDTELATIFFIAAAIFLILTIIGIVLWLRKDDDN